tara:strand:- start:527 stop:667 length:141 start_codon:yes stop_codon:yes gene_type:complete
MEAPLYMGVVEVALAVQLLPQIHIRLATPGVTIMTVVQVGVVPEAP